MEGYIYILHFSQPIAHAWHYTGWALDPNARLVEHCAGRGARLTQVAVERGVTFKIAAIFPGTRDVERQLKNRKAVPHYCPICCQFHNRRCRTIVDARQLELPLDDFPSPPSLSHDRYEIAVTRGWRAARSIAVSNADWDEGLL